MKTTRDFEEQVLRKRPEIDPSWCLHVVAAPLQRRVRPDGRVRHWGEITRAGEASLRILRMVTLKDGESIRNAVFNRGFRGE